MKLGRAIIRGIVSIPHIVVLKLHHRSNFKCNVLQDIAPTVKFYYENGGTINLGKKTHIKRNTEINVSKNALIEIGDNTCINNNCYIASMGNVKIGRRCQIAPGVVIVDHNHNFRDKNGISAGTYEVENIEIGDDVWIGANAVILKGSKIGNKCVVGAGCIVNGEYSENTIIIQKRETITTTFNNK